MESIIAYVLGIVIIFAIILLLSKPIKWALKIALNSVIGGILLLIINFVGGPFGVAIGINFFTALVVGFLGIPGVILLLLLQMIT